MYRTQYQMIFLLCWGLLASPVWARLQLTLPSFVEVQHLQVNLGDIAEVQATAGESTALIEQLKHLPIAQLTQIGQVLQLEARQLQQRLTRLQPALQDLLQLAGAPVVRIQCATQSLSGADLSAPLHDYLRQALAHRYPEARVASLQAQATALTIPVGAWTVRPQELLPTTSANTLIVLAELRVNQRPYKVVRIPFQVELYATALQLLRALPAGAPLSAADVSVLEVTQPLLAPPLATLAALNTAGQLRQAKDVGSLLYRNDLDWSAVKSQQAVQAEVKTGGIILQRTLIAQTAGQIGQIIPVLVPHSNIPYRARVIGAGQVEIQ